MTGVSYRGPRVNDERLGSPHELARQVAARLRLPTIDERTLLALVETTFYASLHEEEGHHAGFGIAWQPAVEDCTSVIAISPPVRVTPKNLAKLAPATRGDATSIAVRASDDGEGLVAWALLERGTKCQPLIVRVLGAGVIRIDLGGVPRALYARGEIRFLDDTVRSPIDRLVHTFGGWARERAAVITHLASRMLAHGHGGLILVVPASLATPIGVRVHYAVGDGATILEHRFEDPEAIDLVARLTAIDNALLVDTDLRVRGFGVQVLDGDAPRMEFEHRDPYTNDVHVDDLSTFKGTRHPAGVIFCMRQPCEAAAIIASQDSRLSLVTKDGARGTVEVLGAYERAFGW